MIERDYIMRMIAMLTTVVRRLMGFKNEHDFPQGLLEVEKACKSLLGVDGSVLELFSEEQLLEVFGRDGEVAPARWYIVGVLLKERGEFLRLMGKVDSAALHDTKSLRMLLESFCAPETTPETGHAQIINALQERAGGRHLPRRTSELLAEYDERVGRYAKAEDIHRDLADEYPDHAPSVVRFYQRMLSMGDDELAAGNLPRSEVVEGLAQIRRDFAL
jgi:Family of unknown function (DUF6483)